MSGPEAGAAPPPAPSVLIAGALSLDLFGGERRAGGAIAYAARAAAALGVRARLLALAGPDADLAALGGHELELVRAERTLTFAHGRGAGGARRLRLSRRPGRALSAAGLPPRWRGGHDLLLLAPLLPDDLDLASFAALPARRRGLLAQGLLRETGADGRVGHAGAPPAALLAAADARTSVFVSEEETARWDGPALATLAAAAERVVVTRGARGAEVLRGAERIGAPAARAARAADATGCGDVFAAAFMVALARGADDAEAGRIGAALAAAALERTGPRALPPLRDVLPDALRGAA